MILTNSLFRSSERIVRAANDQPPMSRGETDAEAVRILQRALVSVGAATLNRSVRAGEADGVFGPETVAGVKRFQIAKGLTDPRGYASGIAGRAFWEAMDRSAPPDLALPSLPPGAPRPETPATLASPARPRLPTAAELMREYRRFRDLPRRGKPCNRPIDNQCGIRMSVALMRCDIGFHYGDGPLLRLLHDSPRACGIDIPHTADLFGLMDHIASFWPSETYSLVPGQPRSVSLSDVIARFDRGPGIVLFREMSELSRPPAPGTETHRHIDYWDGRWVMNDLLNYNAANERRADAAVDRYRFHRRAGTIRFIPLSR